MDRRINVVQKTKDGRIIFEVKDVNKENTTINSELRKEYFNISDKSIILNPTTEIIESDKSIAEDSTNLI